MGRGGLWEKLPNEPTREVRELEYLYANPGSPLWKAAILEMLIPWYFSSSLQQPRESPQAEAQGLVAGSWAGEQENVKEQGGISRAPTSAQIALQPFLPPS